MSESVQFWLDNKMSAGIKVAEINDQVLVAYRDKFYVVERDAAQMRGGRPLHYSKSSMPAIWKKAMRGETPPPETSMALSEELLPITTTTKRERTKKESTLPSDLSNIAANAPESVRKPAQFQPATEAKQSRSAQKMEKKPGAQTTVVANCPYCNHKHEIPLEKGKNGKPFFLPCVRCKTEFAVRFTPVTMYQALVAGFR